MLKTSPPIGRVYGRRRGRPLNEKRATLMETRRDEFAVALPTAPALLDPASLFPAAIRSVGLEIGFGGGEHLAAQAAANPHVGFIGCEPFVNGISSLLALLDEQALTNVRIHSEDARLLLQALQPASIDRAFLLFPDPWPKRRHHGRRFANPEGLTLLAKALTDGAEFRVATDHAELGPWMQAQLDAHPDFTFESKAEERPENWPPTRYEAKAIAVGRKRIYLSYRRKPRPTAEKIASSD
jgi:tRNA (guanine-N7-)-methyltransferase